MKANCIQNVQLLTMAEINCGVLPLTTMIKKVAILLGVSGGSCCMNVQVVKVGKLEAVISASDSCVTCSELKSNVCFCRKLSGENKIRQMLRLPVCV